MRMTALCPGGRSLLLCLLIFLCGTGCVGKHPGRIEPGDIRDLEGEPGLPPTAAGNLPVVIVLEDPQRQHMQLLQVFSARLGRPYEVLDLADRTPQSVGGRLASLGPAQVVAVGPRALRAAAGNPELEVLHTGVLTPEPGLRGVDVLPPFDLQLDYWLDLAPEISSLGVIGSARMQPRIDALAAACKRRGLRLEQRIVGSDKELLLSFRALVPRIDGFVFLPDEQVLSPAVIQQVLNHGRRNDVQTLVYSPVMFALGGTLLLQPDPVDVAVALIGMLQHFDTGEPTLRMQARSRIGRSPPVPAEEVMPLELAGLRSTDG